jgi:hypothetical protein
MIFEATASERGVFNNVPQAIQLRGQVDGSNAAQDIWPRTDTRKADHAAFSLPVTRFVELPEYFRGGSPIAIGFHDLENAVPCGEGYQDPFFRRTAHICTNMAPN